MKVILYDSFEKKNPDQQQETRVPSPLEALIQTLDVMDFYSKLGATRKVPLTENISWIILRMKISN